MKIVKNSPTSRLKAIVFYKPPLSSLLLHTIAKEWYLEEDAKSNLLPKKFAATVHIQYLPEAPIYLPMLWVGYESSHTRSVNLLQNIFFGDIPFPPPPLPTQYHILHILFTYIHIENLGTGGARWTTDNAAVNIQKWNSWTAFLVEVSVHNSIIRRLEFLSGFLPSFFRSTNAMKWLWIACKEKTRLFC